VFEQLSSTISSEVMALQSGREIVQKHMLNAWFWTMEYFVHWRQRC